MQVGSENWADNYFIPERIEWTYLTPVEISSFVEREEKKIDALRKNKQKPLKYQLLVLTDSCYSKDIFELAKLFDHYAVIYPKNIEQQDESTQQFLHQMMAQPMDMTNVEHLLYVLSKTLFSGQYGDKLHIRDLKVSDNFLGKISYEGNNYVQLDGRFGHSTEEYEQIANYVYNIHYPSTAMIELWPEFIKDSTCHIEYHMDLIQSGSDASIVKSWKVDEQGLQNQILIDSEFDGHLHISIFMKGYGKIKIGPCHFRWSRGELGEFVLGGKRYHDADRREFNYYFNPGDFKPPLCVYFSGWRAAEGFEGYFMMKSMGTPFMLICDPRLLGGAFYLGSKDYEAKIVQVIRDALNFLGFDSSQLILSGLSMGTFGALYYGIDLSPHTIIISKPVLSLGTVAKGEHLERAGGFPTSVALLQYLLGSQDDDAVSQLDNRFWDKFTKNNLSNTTIAVAYMKNDDYDAQAFSNLIHYSRGNSPKIIGKGWIGRHNDGSDETISWFVNQYKDIIRKSFRKETKDEE